MEFTADTLLATVTGAIAVPIGQQQPPVENGEANVPQQPNQIVAEQHPGKTPIQRMMESASRMEAEDTRYLQAKESREVAENHYREALRRFQICKKEEVRIQRRRQAAYQLLLRSVNEVGADIKEH